MQVCIPGRTISRTFTASLVTWEDRQHSNQLDTTKSPERKVQRAQVSKLIMAADRLSESRKADTLESYLMSKLSSDQFYTPYRWVAFTRLIRFALARQLFSVAIALYDRMLKEGFVPLSPLRARFAALKLVHSSMKLEDVTESLGHVFLDENYDLSAFMQLLYFLLGVKKTPVVQVDDLARTYFSIKEVRACTCPDLIGELVRINMLAGRLAAAQHWLHTFEDSCKTEGVRPDSIPYADTLDTLVRIDPRNAPAIQAVLHEMHAQGIPPNVSIFNALIRVNVKQQRYREAFELYHVLMQRRSKDLMPNDVTFKLFFHVTRLISQKRRTRRPPNAVEPCVLFRDMLACHLQQTDGQPLMRSTSLSASAFQTALRAFIARGDYLCASIVVHSLDTFGFSANLQTYRIVFANLLSRIRAEIKAARWSEEYRLVDFFTHIQPTEVLDLSVLDSRIQSKQIMGNLGMTPTGQSLSKDLRSDFTSAEPLESSIMWTETVSEFLDFCQPYCQSNDDIFEVILPCIAPSGATNDTPTVPMLIGQDVPPVNDRFSPLPLARLLQKAFLGAMWVNSSHRNGNKWDWRSVVEKAVRHARKRMIPPLIPAHQTGSLRLQDKLKRRPQLPFAASRRRRSARSGWEIDFVAE